MCFPPSGSATRWSWNRSAVKRQSRENRRLHEKLLRVALEHPDCGKRWLVFEGTCANCSSRKTKPIHASLRHAWPRPYVERRHQRYRCSRRHGSRQSRPDRHKSRRAIFRRDPSRARASAGCASPKISGPRAKIPSIGRFRRCLRRVSAAKPTNSTRPILPSRLSADAKNVMRQAFAGMLWSKQFYHYV